MPDSAHNLVIYQWLTNEAFLLRKLLPGAGLLEATPGDTLPHIMAHLPQHTRWFAFHLNCTRTGHFPRDREALLDQLEARGIRTVNARVTDISKRRVQETCDALGLPTTQASRVGDPGERLIIKTDLNFGGDSEWALTDSERAAIDAGPGSNVMWKPEDYLVLPRHEIVDALWEDQTLVMERFITNRDDRWYRAFVWHSQLGICEFTDSSTIKKVGQSQVLRTWFLTTNQRMELPPPIGVLVESLLRFIAGFALEYGAIDFVMADDGASYIIDVNSTPAYNYPVPGLLEHLQSAHR